MAKAPDAFRTISEVSEALNTPAHVLRFWESKFSQIKPVKRAGGRRYYRPDDISLLAGIKHLLHEQGMTIKGAQKLLREKGVKHVAGLVGSPISREVVAETTTAPTKNKEVFSEAPAEDTPSIVQATSVATTPSIDLAEFVPPEAPTALPSRWFASSGKLDVETLRANAANIAPLIQRLEAVRDRMRGT